jgi:hypothetical protein
MSRRDLTFRVFVSSTFSDLVAERNALQQHVFPRLKDYCARHGARFQAVDLRWGVSDEAALDQQTMNICLNELRRCREVSPRPNCLVLLGDRYGWRPLPPQIAADEFEALLEQVPAGERGQLLWEASQRQDEKGWYRRDDNAVPPQYCLLPRAGRFRDSAAWAEKERALRAVFAGAVNRLGWAAADPRRVKYEASATHQEILQAALRVPDPAEQVFCFFRRIRGLPHNADAAGFVDLDDDGRPDVDARERLQRLRDELRQRLPQNVHEYEAEWRDRAPTTDHIGTLPDDPAGCAAMLEDGFEPANLCAAVWQRLARAIKTELTRWRQTDRRDQEGLAHEELGRARTRLFTGRGAVLRKLAAYCQGGSGRPLVLLGEPGSGKSSVMARAAEDLRQRPPGAVVVARFVGATPASANGPELLAGISEEIAAFFGDVRPAPADFADAVKDLPNRLALATAARPLAVFVDGLEQLLPHDPARQMPWLPARLPDHVSVVFSTADEQVAEAIAPNLSGADFVQLDRMPVAEAGQLLDRWLADAGRRLQAEQRAEILDKFGPQGLPLYLWLAFEEARWWKSFDGVPSYRGRRGLAGTVPDAIRDLFWRLSRDDQHGPRLVERTLSYLAVAKQGVAEEEMLEILAGDEEVRAELRRRFPNSPQAGDLPFAVWTRLFAELRPHLVEQTTDGLPLLRLFQRQFADLVREDLLPTREIRSARHRALAAYFERQPDTFGSGTQPFPNHRKCVELPYQLTEAEDLEGMARQVETGFLSRKAAIRGELEAAEDAGRMARVLAGAGPAWWEALVQTARLYARLSADIQKTPDNLEKFVRRGDLRSVISTLEQENNLFRRGVICQALAYLLEHEGQERLAAEYRTGGVALVEANRFDTRHDPRLDSLELALRGYPPLPSAAADLELPSPTPAPAPSEEPVPPRRWVPWLVGATSFPIGFIWLHAAVITSLVGLMALYYLTLVFPFIPFYPVASIIWLAAVYIAFPVLRLVVWRHADPRPEQSRVLRGLRAYHDVAADGDRLAALTRLVEYYARLRSFSDANRDVVLGAVAADLTRLTAAALADMAVTFSADAATLGRFQKLVCGLPAERLPEIQAALSAAAEPDEVEQKWRLCQFSLALARLCPGGSRLYVTPPGEPRQQRQSLHKLQSHLASLPPLLLARSILLWCAPAQRPVVSPRRVSLHPAEPAVRWLTIAGLILAGAPFYGCWVLGVLAIVAVYYVFNYVHDLCRVSSLRRQQADQIDAVVRFMEGALGWSWFFRFVQCPVLRSTLVAERLFTPPERLPASFTAPILQKTLRRLAGRRLAVPRARLVTAAMSDGAQLEAILAAPHPERARVPAEAERERQWRRALPLPRALSIPAVLGVTLVGLTLAVISWRFCSGITAVTGVGCWLVGSLLLLGVVAALEQHWNLTRLGKADASATGTIDAALERAVIILIPTLFLALLLSTPVADAWPEDTSTMHKTAAVVYLLLAVNLWPRHVAHLFLAGVRGSWLFYPAWWSVQLSRVAAVLAFVGGSLLLGYFAALLLP